MVRPDEIKIIVFSRGMLYGLKGIIPILVAIID